MKLHITRNLIYTSELSAPKRKVRWERFIDRALTVFTTTVLIAEVGMLVWVLFTEPEAWRLLLVVVGILSVVLMTKSSRL